MSPSPQARRHGKFFLANNKRTAIVVTIAAVVGGLSLWVIPTLLVRLSTSRVSAVDRLKAEAEARTAVIQLLGGTGLAAGLIYTARTYELTRQQQYTSRFSQAVDQLGNQSVAVRTGAVYALERLSRESSGDTLAIVSLLAAYVRGAAAWDDDSTVYDDIYILPYLLVRANDVQAVLTVLGRLDIPRSGHSVTLVGADLRRAYLSGVDFSGFYLSECHLEIAQLSEANLREAVLDNANLEGALLYGTDLTDASVSGASWTTARVDGATRFPSEEFDWRAEGMVMDSEDRLLGTRLV